MSNPTKDDWKYEAFPKSQREKRIAELEAESAKLNRDVLFLRGACVKPDAVDDYLRVCRRRAELEAENALLKQDADSLNKGNSYSINANTLAGEIVDLQGNLIDSQGGLIAELYEKVAALEAAHSRLRKVADAAVKWHRCYNDVNAYPAAFYALVDAVREYRENLPQNYHSQCSPVVAKGDLNEAAKATTIEQNDGE